MAIEFKNHPDFPLTRPETRHEVLGLLDKYFPGCVEKIATDDFSMLSIENCVLGQTIGWDNRVKMFGEQPFESPWTFSGCDEEWIEAINKFKEFKEKIMKNTTSEFNLKTMPWKIVVNNEVESAAAQLWLFEQGVVWQSGDKEVLQYCKDYPYALKGGNGRFSYSDKAHLSSIKDIPEIKLSFETITSVKNATFPVMETQKDKEIRSVREQMEALASRLKALEGE